MLFTGGAAKPKKEDKKEKKLDRDEKYEIQENVFVRWGNSLLANEPLKDFRDLCETKYMNLICQIVTGNQLTLSGVRYDDCVSILAQLGDVKTPPADIVDGQQKAVLGVWWRLIEAFWKKFGPDPIREEKITEAVKQWCLEVTKDYQEVSVCDFTSSWRDGHAFNCLLHNFDRKLVSLKKLYECSASERIENAFGTAEREFKVPRLLMVKELQSEHLDTRSVVCYLMTLYLSLIGKSSHTPTTAAAGTPQMRQSESPSQPPSHHPSTSHHKHSPEHTTAAPPLVHQSTVIHQETPATATPPPTPSHPAEQTHPHHHHHHHAQQVEQQQQSQQHQPAPPRSPPEGRQRARQQASVDQLSESVEVRSRKSSSSSQKSGRSRRERKEAMSREFENCLEQVLTWLLEAEEELSLLDEVAGDVAMVRAQFKEFEQFMASLTDSQETVGKVLHRGQLLCNKADSEEEKEAIQGQLQIVNQRWEELREMALMRQSKLHAQLYSLQHRQLSSICRWLSSVEAEITAMGPLAVTTEGVLEQIEEHGRLQTKIDEFQPTIRSLNAFVAVVEESDSAEDSVASLEQSMSMVGERWQNVCQWAEERATALDGLAEIVAQTSQVFDRLSSWLKDREHELLGLKSAHHLDDPEQVADQVRKLQQAEAALEAEHGQFVRLSQLSCELVSRLDTGNGAAANDVRRRLDTVTQRWDNLVARIEEHSKTLVRSGKADVKQLKRKHAKSTEGEEKHRREEREGEGKAPSEDSSLTIDESVKTDRVLAQDKDMASVQMTSLANVELLTETTDTEGEDAGNVLVDRFLRHVARLSEEMEDLRSWTESFTVSRRPDQVRRMISVCQEKLVEIKDQEAKVTRLQLELEHIHLSNSLNAKQLRKANDAFDTFAKGWARIVTKISEAMNVLTGHADEGEEAAIAQGIQDWIEGCERVLADVARAPVPEQAPRRKKLEQQLKLQTSNLDFVEKDVARRAILKKGLEILKKKIDNAKSIKKEEFAEEQSLAEPEPSSGSAEAILEELEGSWCSVGDVTQLDKDLERSTRLVEMTRNGEMTGELVGKAETRKAEMEERRRATVAALEKMSLAEKTLQDIRSEVDAISRRHSGVTTVLTEFQTARERLASRLSEKKEAERATEKMLALDENVPTEVVTTNRERVRAITSGWTELDQVIEDHLSCARKEQRRSVQKAISDEEKILEQLERTLERSESVQDAEECCEQIDTLENLLEQVPLPLEPSSMDESFVRDNYARVSLNRKEIEDKAKRRLEQLNKAVEECEQFDREMSSIHQWASTISPLLDSRRAQDVSALDVPEEYKAMSTEFSSWEQLLSELSDWLKEEERKGNERMRDQLDHAKNTFATLKQKFNEFKKPKSFDEKLEKVTRRLTDIETALDDMTGIDGSFCEEALSECRRMAKKLHEMDDDLAGLEKGKQELVQGGILDKTGAAAAAEKIRFAQRKRKELGLRAESNVDRLEDCIELIEQMGTRATEVDGYLEELEKRLQKFAEEDKSGGEAEAEQLVCEWNRREAELRALEDSERLLRERAVRVDERVCEQRRRRADELKRRLDGWSTAVQEMENDEEAQLLELDDLHQSLMEGLAEAEQQPPSQLAETLRFLRGDRDRLSSRARRISAANPRLANSDLISDVTKRWNELESKLHEPEQPTADKTDQTTNQITEDMPFAQQVSMLDEKLKSAGLLVDFDASPVCSVTQWSERVEALDALLNSYRPILDRVMGAGRRIANEGRLELDQHRAIEELDDICDEFDSLEQHVEDNRISLSGALPQADSLARDVTAMEQVIETLLQRPLDQSEVADATRRDLVERDTQLTSLSQRAASLHSTLPGSSPQTRDVALLLLSEKMSRLEAALSGPVPYRAAMNATPIKTSPDRTSASSMGPLAMEVHGNFTDAYTTEDDTRDEVMEERTEKLEETARDQGKEETAEKSDEARQARPKIISPEETSPNREEGVVAVGPPITEEQGAEPSLTVAYAQPITTMMEVEENSESAALNTQAETARSDVAKAFANLDMVDEELTVDEEFPMERLEDVDERVAKYSSLLDDVTHTIDEHEMTLDMMRVELSRERVHNLRMVLDERRQKSSQDKKEWQQLLDVLFEAEKTLSTASAASEWAEPGRSPTPPLEEALEKQAQLEALLPRAESLTSESVRRLSLVLPRLKEEGAKAIGIRDRTREVETRFRALTTAATEARARLEARAVRYDDVKKEVDQVVKWCDAVSEGSCPSSANPLDSSKAEEMKENMEKWNRELVEKKGQLISLEQSKVRLLANAAVDSAHKHELRRACADAAKKLADLRSDLSDRGQRTAEQFKDCEAFWQSLDQLEERAIDLHKRAAAVSTASIYTPSPENVAACRADSAHLRADMAVVKEKVQRANAVHGREKLTGKHEKRVVSVLTEASMAIDAVAAIPEEAAPSTSDSTSTNGFLSPNGLHAPSEGLDSSMGSSQATIIDKEEDVRRRTASEVASSAADRFEDEDTEEDEPEVAGSLSRQSQLSSIRDQSLPPLPPREEHFALSLTQLRHWLTEAERDGGLTVDLADAPSIRQMATTVQGIVEQIRLKIRDAVGVQDASGVVAIKQKARDLASDMERVMQQCDRRRIQLGLLADESRSWETSRTEMELWMETAEETIGERCAEESSDVSMRDELAAVERIVAELDERKTVMESLNEKGNRMLDEYSRDEAHALSHHLSRLNMRWTKFNDNIRIRRAVLEASLRSRSDFHSALGEFEEWLERMVESVRLLETQTSNIQAIKDTAKRREWSQQQKVVRAELDAHDSVLTAVDSMGRKMASGLDVGKEKNGLTERLDSLNSRWRAVRETDETIRNRLEGAEQEWEKLTHNLSSLISWTEDKSKEALSQQPVGGSLSTVMSQGAWVKGAEREMQARAAHVKDTVAAAHSYLMQNDLRPRIHRAGVLADVEEMDDQKAEQRRCGLQIHSDCEQLKQKWAELGTQLASWGQTVQSAGCKLQELEAALAECQLHLSSVESELEKAKPVEQILLEDLKDARVASEALAAKVDSLRVHVDDANDACGKILAADLPLDSHPRNQIDAVNQRFLSLRTTMRVRVAALRNALSDFGPSSEHFLSQSVTAPWQRAISKTNHLPYYIDHTTERTQWEHPVWVEMSKELSQFNRVKFIAYRTSMKLRALQKRLCLDLVDIPMLEKAFTRLGGLSNEECPALEGMVCCLLPLFEQLHAKHPQQIRSVALAVDLSINFLLNLFDPSRDGILRVLSFKIALVVLSNAQLEEKYRYMFQLVAQEGQADQKHIALLLYDLIHIPRLVGEAAAFGGSNVEPSVRSCFETVRLAPSMGVASFLDWLKQEPQSIVWLPVVHRLAAAEFAKHSAKCNVCKMFPIVGLRYRCLRCFNLDLCQNCFFSQRVAKKHKLKHPMQEYAVPTTSTEDARDFAKMVRNKFGKKRSSLGYLPVEVGDEGRPLAAPPAQAHNPWTEALHQRTGAMAERLATVVAAQPAEPRDDVVEVKSPAQLISQVEQMQKDELDQLLQRLQLENLELKRELGRKKAAAASTPQLDRLGHMSPAESRRSEGGLRAGTLPRMPHHGRSVPSLKSAQSQNDVMDEARALRVHKQRLEHRSRILEQQNEQLELQLQRLKKVIDQQKESSTPRIDSWSAEREWPERRSQPPSQQPQTPQSPQDQWDGEEPRTTRMQSLLATVDDLGRAMESLVVSVVYDSEPDD